MPRGKKKFPSQKRKGRPGRRPLQQVIRISAVVSGLGSFAGKWGAGTAPEVAGRKEEDGGPENEQGAIADENDQESGEAVSCVGEPCADCVAKLCGDGFDRGVVLFPKREVDV